MTEEYKELEGFTEGSEEEDDEDLEGGVREPKEPILPVLPGGDEAEVEREFEFDMHFCAHV